MAAKQKNETNKALGEALSQKPGIDLLKDLALDVDILPKGVRKRLPKGIFPSSYKWLKTSDERRDLITAAITLRKHMIDNGIEHAAFIETSSRPIAFVMTAMENERMPVGMRMVEGAISRLCPATDSKIDEKRLALRHNVVRFGGLADKFLNRVLRNKRRMKIWNLAPPESFEYNASLGRSIEEKVKHGWLPAYAIFRERACDFLGLLFHSKEKVIFIDDFVETGETMRSMQDFLKRIKWIDSKIGDKWVNGSIECYKQAHELWFESYNHVGEVSLGNISFASLYGHSNWEFRKEFPKDVFVAKHRMFPPLWHPSSKFPDEYGKYQQVHCSLEAVIQRRGYPWATPITEVDRLGEYADAEEIPHRKHVVGMPYAPIETPILHSRIGNLDLAVEMAYPHAVKQIINSENTSRFLRGQRKMNASYMVMFVSKLKQDQDYALEMYRQWKPSEERISDEDALAIAGTDPNALVRAFEELNSRPAQLEADLRRLARRSRLAIRVRLGKLERSPEDMAREIHGILKEYSRKAIRKKRGCK